MSAAAILAILSALTNAIPAATQLITEFEAINGPSAELQAALASLKAANDAAFTATDAKLIADDKGA